MPNARFMVIDYFVLIVYFALLIAMGAYISRRESSTEAFFLGGRRVPWWAVGISIFGTSISAITYLTIPALAFDNDWGYLIINMAIVFVAPVVASVYVPRFHAWPVTTAYEYLETRFNLAIRIYGSLTFFAFQLARIGIVLYLPAIALSTATGLNVYFCVLAMGVIATAYTVLGGIEAVIWTDVIQAVVLVAGAVMALGIVSSNVDGGLAAVFSSGLAEGKLHAFDLTWDVADTALWLILLHGIFSILYPATADQTVVQRYLSTASVRDAKRAVWTNAIVSIPISFLFFGLGTALWAFYRDHPGDLDPSIQNDAILPFFVVQHFPPGLAGLLIAGVFAASMSSLDSSLNSISTVLVNDYYRRFRPNIDDRHALNVARGLTLLFGLLGTLAALYVVTSDIQHMFKAWQKMVGMIGGGLSGIMALAVFTRRANGIGAVCGALAATAVLAWLQLGTDAHHFLYAFAAFTTAVSVGYAVSLLFGKNKPHHTD